MGNGGERGGRGWNRGIEEPPCYRVGQMQPCCQRLALGIVQVKCSYVVQVRTRHLLCIALRCSALLCIALRCSALCPTITLRCVHRRGSMAEECDEVQKNKTFCAEPRSDLRTRSD